MGHHRDRGGRLHRLEHGSAHALPDLLGVDQADSHRQLGLQLEMERAARPASPHDGNEDLPGRFGGFPCLVDVLGLDAVHQVVQHVACHPVADVGDEGGDGEPGDRVAERKAERDRDEPDQGAARGDGVEPGVSGIRQ